MVVASMTKLICALLHCSVFLGEFDIMCDAQEDVSHMPKDSNAPKNPPNFIEIRFFPTNCFNLGGCAFLIPSKIVDVMLILLSTVVQVVSRNTIDAEMILSGDF
jgi:hypothetical protein